MINKDYDSMTPELRDMLWRHAECEPLPGMGYWQEERVIVSCLGPARENPMAREEVLCKVGEIDSRERIIVLAYMVASTRGTSYMGYAGCRLCNVILGSSDMVTPDKKWKFPENWQHYIVAHSVVPDRKFIDDATKWYENIVGSG